MSVEIDALELEVSANSEQAAGGIARLQATLAKLKSTLPIAKLEALSRQLTSIGGAANNLSGVNKLARMAQSLAQLKALEGLKLSSTIGNQLRNIGEAARSLSGADFDGVTRMAAALAPLSGLGRANLTSFINQLDKLPALAARLKSADMDGFTAGMRRLSAAMAPFSAQLFKTGTAFSSMPARVQQVVTATNRLAVANHTAGKSYGVLGTGISGTAIRLSALYLALRRASSYLGGWITESTDYVENLNLFTVAMGRYAGEAKAYAETVSEVMGIDPSEWMRGQGVFMTLATGFGVAGDRAALMSKNLTQLAYDVSSYYNKTVEESTNAIRSGLSGEIEPVRNLGYDLSEARLKAIAAANGIQKSYTEMTQAEKAQLRYIALMTQVTQVQGDMARTLESPANQLRIFRAALTQASRALGNVFIPALNAVLPYAIAFLKVIRFVASEIASLFGFTLPELDTSGMDGLGSSADDASGALGSAADAAKELQKYTMGFDELNIIDPSGGKGGSGGGGFGGELGVPLPEYDFLGDAVAGRAGEIFDEWMKKVRPAVAWLKDNFKSLKESVKPFVEWLKENFDIILDIAGSIALGLIGWKIASNVVQFFDKLEKFFINNKSGISLALAITGISLTFSGGAAMGRGDATAWDYIKIALGAAFNISASLLKFGVNAVGFTVGIGITLVALLIAMTFGYKQRLEDLYEASEMKAIIDEIKGSIENNTEIILELKAKIRLRAESVEEFEQDWNYIFELVEKIYDLVEKPDKTPGEIAILQTYIDTFNELDLGDIKLEYDKLKGEINYTKDAVTNLLKEQYKLAKQEIYLEKFKEAEAEQAEAQKSLLFIDQDRAKLEELRVATLNQINAKTEQLSSLEKQNVAYLEEHSEFSTEISEMQAKVTKEIETLQGTLPHINEELSEAEKKYAETQNAVEEINRDVEYWRTQSEELVNSMSEGVDSVEGRTAEAIKKMKMDTFIALKSVQAQLNGLTIPTLELDIKVPSVQVNLRNLKNDQIKMEALTYATGGMPDAGQLFLARESGPELVGTIGGRTSVVNNDQIVESVARGVYDAFRAARGGTDASGGEFHVYLDGREVTARVEKRQRERGASIYGGVYNPV